MDPERLRRRTGSRSRPNFRSPRAQARALVRSAASSCCRTAHRLASDAEPLLWAAVSRAVRTPSRIDRDLVAPAILVAATEFRSEKLVAFEAGYRGQPSGTTSISIFAVLQPLRRHPHRRVHRHSVAGQAQQQPHRPHLRPRSMGQLAGAALVAAERGPRLARQAFPARTGHDRRHRRGRARQRSRLSGPAPLRDEPQPNR